MVLWLKRGFGATVLGQNRVGVTMSGEEMLKLLYSVREDSTSHLINLASQI